MNCLHFSTMTMRCLRTIWGKALACLLLSMVGTIHAQDAPSVFRGLLPQDNHVVPDSVPPGESGPQGPIVDPNVRQASCPGCTSYGTNPYGPSPTGCVPGRKQCCNGCQSDTHLGRFCCGLCDAICCTDPCYEPMWVPEANAAFFQDPVRPITMTRLRWDHGEHYGFPDSAEFFWAKIGTKKSGIPTAFANYNQLSFYQEIAAKGFSVFVEVPYANVYDSNGFSNSGIGDMNVGVKSLLFDREILQVSFQFRTYIPTGNFSNGLGTGHVSMEPSLLTSCKLGQATYLQTQISEWIPIAGTGGFAGSVFGYHASLNHCLCNWDHCFRLVGTAEVNGYSFRGSFTQLDGTVQSLNGGSYANIGPGLRATICDHCDIGIGIGFGIGNGHGPDQIYRTELRLRY